MSKELQEDLALFITNDGGLYQRYIRPICLNLAKKKVTGTYRKELAVKAFEYVVKPGLVLYNRTFGYRIQLTPQDRYLLAREILEEKLWEIQDAARQMKTLRDGGHPWTNVR